MDNKDWLNYKRYLHIDRPIEPRDATKVIAYVRNPIAVAKHPFLPLVRRVEKILKFKSVQGSDRKKCTIKKRPLTFAAHLDANIYSYYASILQEKYENFVTTHDLNNVAVAYRRIPVDPAKPKKGNKCNIEIAHDAFVTIQSMLNEYGEVRVFTYDIKGFFDNLDHDILKSQWCAIQGYEKRLPADEFHVFESVTDYAYIFEQALFYHFKDKIICKRNDGTIVNRRVRHRGYLRDAGAIAYCEKTDIKEIRDAHLINTRSHKDGERIGIPQGLPISAVLANIYMSSFDVEVNSIVVSHGGMYKRYSDDIIIALPGNVDADSVNAQVHEAIAKVKLIIESHKTQRYVLTKMDKKVSCQQIQPDNSLRSSSIEYLGFAFDGRRILLKNATLGKYYHKMQRHVRYATRMAIRIKNPRTKGNLFFGRLLHLYSYSGAEPHGVYTRCKKNGRFVFEKSKRKSWGNFVTYARKSNRIMHEPDIIRQLRRNRHKLKKLIQNSQNTIHVALPQVPIKWYVKKL